MQNNTLSCPGFSLSGTALKRIACLSMLVDHLGASLLENGLFRCSAIDPRLVGLDQLLRLVGRLAFPIYCFLLVEGFLHTHDLKKYALRMLGFALISEWPFDWAFFSGVYWGHQNVYFTLLLGLLAMKALDTSQTPEGMPALKGILGAAACFLAAALLHCDYDVLGLALILALYMTRKDKRAQCIAGAVFSLFEPVAPLAFGLVWFYSGERGGSSKLEQWAFYWFYPAHIFVLGVLANLVLFRLTRSCFHKHCTPLERSFCSHTALLSLAIRQDCCGKSPCLWAKILVIRRTLLTKTASNRKL